MAEVKDPTTNGSDQYTEMDTMDLLKLLTEQYIHNIPEQIVSAEDAANAAQHLSKIVNAQTYLTTLLSKINILKRANKAAKNKEKADDYLAKEDTIKRLIGILDEQYKGISRMITIRSDNLKELQMNGKL